MASFRLMNRVTGAVLAGYRVLSAAADEIDQANRNLRINGSPFRFVQDMHPPEPSAQWPMPALQAVQAGGSSHTQRFDP